MNDHRVRGLCLKLSFVPRSLVAQLVPLIERRKLHIDVVATKIISQFPTEVLRGSDQNTAHDRPLFPKSTYATKAMPDTATVDWATITHTNPPLSSPSPRSTAVLVPHDAGAFSYMSRALATSLLSPVGLACLILSVLLLLLVYTAASRKEAKACRREVEELRSTNEAAKIEIRFQQLEDRAEKTEAESRKIDAELHLAKKRIDDDKTLLESAIQRGDNLATNFGVYVEKTKVDSRKKDDELQVAKKRIDDGKTRIRNTETHLEAAIQRDDLATKFEDYVEMSKADSRKKDEQLRTDVDNANNQIGFAKTAIESLQQKPVLTIANVESLITPLRKTVSAADDQVTSLKADVDVAKEQIRIITTDIEVLQQEPVLTRVEVETHITSVLDMISQAEKSVTSLEAQVNGQGKKQAQTDKRLQQQGDKIEGQSRQLVDVQLTLKSIDTRGTAIVPIDRTRSARQQRRKAAKEAEKAAPAYIDSTLLPFLARFSIAGPSSHYIPRFETGRVFELNDDDSEDDPTSTALIKYTGKVQAPQPTTSSPASGPSSSVSITGESAEPSAASTEGSNTPPASDPQTSDPQTSDSHESTEQATASSEGNDTLPTSDPAENNEHATSATQNPPPTGPSAASAPRESARARHWRIFLESKRTGNGFFDSTGAWRPNNPRWSAGGGRGEAVRGGRGGGGRGGQPSRPQPPVQQGWTSPAQFDMNWDAVLGRWVPRQ